MLETAGRVGAFDEDILRWSLKALLCGRGDEWRRFDSLFDAYFLPPNRKAFADSPATNAGATERAGGVGEGGRELPIASAADHGLSTEDDDPRRETWCEPA